MPWPFVHGASAADRMELRIPVIAMVLAATAIPIELRAPGHWTNDFAPSALLVQDIVANILGYVPVGLVLRDMGALRGFAVATVMAFLAEAAQLVMVHRDPSLVDVAANAIGAGLGLAIAVHWDIRRPALALGTATALAALLLAGVSVAAVWAMRGEPPSTRGVTQPGRLEARWRLDERSGRIAADSSGNGHNGRYSTEPRRTDAGPDGPVALFDGKGGTIDAGNRTALRLAGSMTVSAWIRPVAYPADDAAIVSSLAGDISGFQLDVTPDRGPRTIGFKIADECGQLTARYGATPLRLNVWHHVAGVYDAQARTLDVYWNGRLDNGFLLGTVTGAQHPSRAAITIARRSAETGFEFAGAIRDVRIYSLALTAAEIGVVMRGELAEAAPPGDAAGRTGGAKTTAGARPAAGNSAACAITSDHEDRHVPIAAMATGLFVTLAGVALWPARRKTMPLWLGASLAAGALLPTAPLPPINLWLLPLTSLIGSAAVLLALRRSARGERTEAGER